MYPHHTRGGSTRREHRVRLLPPLQDLDELLSGRVVHVAVPQRACWPASESRPQGRDGIDDSEAHQLLRHDRQNGVLLRRRINLHFFELMPRTCGLRGKRHSWLF